MVKTWYIPLWFCSHMTSNDLCRPSCTVNNYRSYVHLHHKLKVSMRWFFLAISHWVRSSLAPSNLIFLILASGHPPLDLNAILPLLHLTLSRFDIFEDAGDADGVSHRVWTPDVASAIVVTPKIVKLTIFITT